MTMPGMDYAALAARWQAEHEAATKAARNQVLAGLRTHGITEVTAEYEGYGDSGNVEDLALRPAGVAIPDELSTRLADFVWSFASDRHPGFENNDGGYGTLTWDIAADSITLDHAGRYVDVSYSYSYDEDL